METAKKYAIGFLMFALYFTAMRVIENKVPAYRKLTQPAPAA